MPGDRKIFVPWSRMVSVFSTVLDVLFKIQSIETSKTASAFPSSALDASAAGICWLRCFGSYILHRNYTRVEELMERQLSACTSFQQEQGGKEC